MTMTMTRRAPKLILGAVLALTSATGLTDDFDLDWYTIDGGGEMWTTGGDFELSGTIGQHDASTVVLAGGDFELTGGFWTLARPSLPVVPPSEVERLDAPADDAELEPPPWP